MVIKERAKVSEKDRKIDGGRRERKRERERERERERDRLTTVPVHCCMDDQYCPALLALSQVFHRGGGAHDGGDGGGGVPNANAEQTTATMCENGEDNSKYADFNDDDGSEGNSRTIRSK